MSPRNESQKGQQQAVLTNRVT